VPLCHLKLAAASTQAKRCGCVNGAPQLLQNLLSSGLSPPHFKQRIFPPNQRLYAQLIEQRLGLFKIWQIETFGEPIADFADSDACFIAAVGVAQ